MNEEIFKKISHYMSLGKVSVFVGAGVSRLSGYPSWNALVRKMSDEIGYTEVGEERVFSSEELLKIPQMYHNEREETAYLDMVKNEFAGKYEINEVHDLIFSLKPKHILTTNYDTLLEQTAVKFGKNYSVINADDSVSACDSNQYIIKLHGDFERSFVLKEEDYLNYEVDYMLVDKIVKSIFATTLVIFVGYSLNDYNIKLILNWVKNVQADTFINPVFVHTDAPLSKLERDYQVHRGLDVLDCNDFGTFGVDEYANRYKSVLKSILDNKDLKNSTEAEDKIERINEALTGIGNLQYIRTSDFNYMMKNKYHMGDFGTIADLSNLSSFDKKDYSIFSIDDIDEEFEKKYPAFLKFIKQCDIEESRSRCRKRDISQISNISFLSDNQEMECYCLEEYDDNYMSFKKAYYLSQLARFEESYTLFTKLVFKLKENEEWDLYYLAQVNRGYLYKIISQLEKWTTGIGALSLGGPVKVYEDDFIKTLNYEMENFELDQQFGYLPLYFRSKFGFLECLCKENPYNNEYIKLIEAKNKILQDAVSRTRYVAGISKADTIKFKILEEIKFAYDNMILFTGFKEYKEYIKTTMITWLEYYAKECEQQKKGLKADNNCCYNFTFTDIVVLSRTCAKDDIDYLRRLYVFEYVVLDEEDYEKLKNYLLNQLDTYKTIIGKDKCVSGEKIFLWQDKSTEILRLLEISAYFINDSETVLNVFDQMREITNSRIILSEIVRIMKIFIRKSKMAENIIIDYVEKWLVEIYKDDIGHFCKISELLADFNEKNSLNIISHMIVEGWFDEKHLQSMNNLFIMLNAEAQDKIEQIQEFTVVNVQTMYGETKIPDKNIIYKACKNSFDTIIDKRKSEQKGIHISYGVYTDDEIIKTGTILLLENNCDDKAFLDEYLGINEEYDYWFADKEYTCEEIDIHWIEYYSDAILDKIKSDAQKKEQMLNALVMDSNLKSAEDGLVKRIFYVYRYLIQ